jgi:peptidoglycan LD-endopeptidase LytH
MASHRTTARGILVLLAGACIAAAPTAAARPLNLPPPPAGSPAKGPQPEEPPAAPKPPPIVFPVVGPAKYYDDFGEPRAGRRHQGNDILAAKRSLAVAAEAGKVKLWTTSASAGCMLYLYGRSGTTYLYIHLNNDVTSGNDNRGKCVAGTAYAKGIRSGTVVRAGQPVGFVGDSGDANGLHAHLHFEMHPKGGKAVSPFPYLRRVQHLLYAAAPGSLVSLTLKGRIAATPAGTLELAIDSLRASTGLRIANVGVTVSLDLPPDAVVTATTSLIGAPRLARGKSVTVTTVPTETTLDAELAKPGALTVASVTLLS